MSDKPENPPAFPCPDGADKCYMEPAQLDRSGMTLRDYFASTLAPGFIGDVEEAEDLPTHAEVVAFLAYTFADALLKEREKPPGETLIEIEKMVKEREK